MRDALEKLLDPAERFGTAKRRRQAAFEPLLAGAWGVEWSRVAARARISRCEDSLLVLCT
jgi:hypothetical protein